MNFIKAYKNFMMDMMGMEMQMQSVSENLLGEFIRTLFCQEMYQRRCRRKRCR